MPGHGHGGRCYGHYTSVQFRHNTKRQALGKDLTEAVTSLVTRFCQVTSMPLALTSEDHPRLVGVANHH
jgi:hypothetical protein